MELTYDLVVAVTDMKVLNLYLHVLPFLPNTTIFSPYNFQD